MIVVTGGAGMIGSQLIRELNEAGRTDIIVIDDLENGRSSKNIFKYRYSLLKFFKYGYSLSNQKF